MPPRAGTSLLSLVHRDGVCRGPPYPCPDFILGGPHPTVSVGEEGCPCQCVKWGEIPGWELPKPPEMLGAAGHRGCLIPTQLRGEGLGGGKLRGKKKKKEKKKEAPVCKLLDWRRRFKPSIEMFSAGPSPTPPRWPREPPNGVLGPKSNFGEMGMAALHPSSDVSCGFPAPGAPRGCPCPSQPLPMVGAELEEAPLAPRVAEMFGFCVPVAWGSPKRFGGHLLNLGRNHTSSKLDGNQKFDPASPLHC